MKRSGSGGVGKSSIVFHLGEAWAQVIEKEGYDLALWRTSMDAILGGFGDSLDAGYSLEYNRQLFRIIFIPATDTDMSAVQITESIQGNDSTAIRDRLMWRMPVLTRDQLNTQLATQIMAQIYPIDSADFSLLRQLFLAECRAVRRQVRSFTSEMTGSLGST